MVSSDLPFSVFMLSRLLYWLYLRPLFPPLSSLCGELVPRGPLQKLPARGGGLKVWGPEGGGKRRRSEGRRGLHLRKASRGLQRDLKDLQASRGLEGGFKLHLRKASRGLEGGFKGASSGSLEASKRLEGLKGAAFFSAEAGFGRLQGGCLQR